MRTHGYLNMKMCTGLRDFLNAQTERTNPVPQYLSIENVENRIERCEYLKYSQQHQPGHTILQICTKCSVTMISFNSNGK